MFVPVAARWVAAEVIVAVFGPKTTGAPLED